MADESETARAVMTDDEIKGLLRGLSRLAPPWEVRKVHPFGWDVRSTRWADENTIVAHCSGHGADGDARLIAAAPYLAAEVLRLRAERVALDDHDAAVRADERAALARAVPPSVETSALRKRYTPRPVPPCRVCGGELSLQACGCGPSVWACSGREPDPERPGATRWQDGRSIADDHYARSQWEQYGGDDEDVLTLCNAYDALRAALTARDAEIATLRAERDDLTSEVCRQAEDIGNAGKALIQEREAHARLVEAAEDAANRWASGQEDVVQRRAIDGDNGSKIGAIIRVRDALASLRGAP